MGCPNRRRHSSSRRDVVFLKKNSGCAAACLRSITPASGRSSHQKTQPACIGAHHASQIDIRQATHHRRRRAGRDQRGRVGHGVPACQGGRCAGGSGLRPARGRARDRARAVGAAAHAGGGAGRPGPDCRALHPAGGGRGGSGQADESPAAAHRPHRQPQQAARRRGEGRRRAVLDRLGGPGAGHERCGQGPVDAGADPAQPGAAAGAGQVGDRRQARSRAGAERLRPGGERGGSREQPAGAAGRQGRHAGDGRRTSWRCARPSPGALSI